MNGRDFHRKTHSAIDAAESPLRHSDHFPMGGDAINRLESWNPPKPAIGLADWRIFLTLLEIPVMMGAKGESE